MAARRDREPALRVRLVGDTDAVVGRRGVHFLRGREAFWLDERAVAKLVDVYRELDEIRERDGVSLDDALGRLLSGGDAETAVTSS